MDVRQVFEPVIRELELVETELKARVDSIAATPVLSGREYDEVTSMVGQIFARRGKRLRPALLLLASRAVDTSDERLPAITAMATAVELLHSASLVHDDVVDETELRRGEPSVNGRYGNKIAVLVGDLLYTQFFSIVSSLPGIPNALKLRLLGIFEEITRKMCAGELFELRARTARLPVTVENYLAIIDDKTASLMAGCCLSGALLAGADGETAAALEEYGRLAGVSYQLMDDLIDSDAVFTDSRILRSRLEETTKEAGLVLKYLPASAARECLGLFSEHIRTFGLMKTEEYR